jgi:hypothetical protein
MYIYIYFFFSVPQMFWILSSEFRLGWWPFFSSFIRDFGQDWPFLRLICRVAWQWVLLFLMWQLLGVQLWCLSPDFLSGMGPLEQAGTQKLSCERLVNELLPAHSTHRANPWFRNELFSWWDCHFQLAHGFSKAVKSLAFLTGTVE